MPMLVLRLVLDRDLRGAEALLLDGAGHQPHVRNPERLNARIERGQVHAGVDQRAERHVAADAAGTIEIGDLHAVLYVTTQRRTGAWLAEAFASDSACEVTLEEAFGAAAGLARLREVVFDAVLISHEPEDLDALDLVDGLRAGGALEPLIVLGQPSEQEMAALCYEVGADAYLCVNTATTRTLLWIVARATERHHLIRENRRLSQAERHRLRQEHGETERLLEEQRGLIRDMESPSGASAADDEAQIPSEEMPPSEGARPERLSRRR